MRWKVDYIENKAERTVSLQIVVRGTYDAHDRKQKPLGSDLDDPRYRLEAVQSALYCTPGEQGSWSDRGGPTHIDATASDYGLLHNNPVREDENVVSRWQRGENLKRTC